MARRRQPTRYSTNTVRRWGQTSLVCDLFFPAALFGLGVATAAVPQNSAAMDLIIGIAVFCVFIVFLVGVVATNRVLYMAWAQIQDHPKAISPGLAIGLNFVPLVNIVWIYFSFAGLAARMNEYLRVRKIEGPRASQGRCITACVLMSLGIIPYIGILFALLGYLFFILALASLVRTAAAIAGSPAPASPRRRKRGAHAEPTPAGAPVMLPTLAPQTLETEPPKPRKRRSRKSQPFDEPEKL